MPKPRALATLTGLAAIIGLSLFFAATNPLLQWREPVYIIAGFAGVVGMVLLLLQPLLASGLMPGASGARGRRIHRMTGAALVFSIVLHVGGLWITSPPDVIDALTFTSPTPFAVWGVVAMWAAFAAALLAIYRSKLSLRLWRPAHAFLVVVVVIGTAVHAVLIQGTMEPISKAVLALACLGATGTALYRMKPWSMLRRRSPHAKAQ